MKLEKYLKHLAVGKAMAMEKMLLAFPPCLAATAIPMVVSMVLAGTAFGGVARMVLPTFTSGAWVTIARMWTGSTALRPT